MKPRGRWTRILKWSGVAGCGLIAAAFVASLCCSVACIDPPLGGGVHRGWFLSGGGLRIGWDFYYIPRYEDLWGPPHVPRRWYVTGPPVSSARLQYAAWPRIHRRIPGGPLADGGEIVIPLWLPFVAVLTPTLLIWRRNRPSAPGLCGQCQYSLTGNTSGVCSECGSAVPRVVIESGVVAK